MIFCDCSGLGIVSLPIKLGANLCSSDIYALNGLFSDARLAVQRAQAPQLHLTLFMPAWCLVPSVADYQRAFKQTVACAGACVN